MTEQRPLGTGLGPRTSAREVLGDRRLDGVLVVITGGGAGVGLETVRVLAGAGAEVRVGARVVCLSSRGHRRGQVDFEDPSFLRRPYDKWVAYGQSKTANALFALGLDARGAPHGVRAFSVHPGAIVETDLARSLPPEELQAAIAAARQAPAGLKAVAEGAATSVWCAVSPRLAGLGGVSCEDRDVALAVPGDHPDPGGVRPWARDPEQAERLWAASEAWTGARLG